jgi:hypothetical protein
MFEDLTTDQAKVYADILEFLDLPKTPLPRARQHRARDGYRIGWLQRLLKRPPIARTVLGGEHFRKRISSAPHRQPSRLSRKVMAARKVLLDWNRAPAPPVRLRPRFVEEIRKTLQDDVTMLSRLLGRDLSHWLGESRDESASLDKAA